MLQQRGYRVVMTRDRDVYPSLEERWNLANRIGPDLFVSLHADSCATPSVTGFTVYIAEGASWTSKRAAQSIADSLASLGRNSRGVRPAKYKVLINTRCPAVLVEMGYLTNYWEARQLNDTGVQARIAQAIVAGIERTIR